MPGAPDRPGVSPTRRPAWRRTIESAGRSSPAVVTTRNGPRSSRPSLTHRGSQPKSFEARGPRRGRQGGAEGRPGSSRKGVVGPAGTRRTGVGLARAPARRLPSSRSHRASSGKAAVHAQEVDVRGGDPAQQRRDEGVRRAATHPPAEELPDRSVGAAPPPRNGRLRHRAEPSGDGHALPSQQTDRRGRDPEAPGRDRKQDLVA
jgi:hypothetical protein